MKKILLLIVLLSSVLPACNSLLHKSQIVANNNEYLQELYSGTLSRMYEYMFVQEAPYQTIKDKQYGVFQAGFKGLVLYTNFTETIRTMENIEVEGYPSFYDLSPLRVMSGLKVFTTPHEEFDQTDKLDPKEPFHHYNPKFIKWASKYLIPNPELEILGHPAKTLYKSTFSRFFRLLTLAYKYMHSELNPTVEIEGYRKAMSQNGFEAYTYLGERYIDLQLKGTEFDEVYVGEFNPSFGMGGFLSHSTFSPTLAVAWWCRRGIDGTKDECWKALEHIMKTYDPEWYDLKMSDL